MYDFSQGKDFWEGCKGGKGVGVKAFMVIFPTTFQPLVWGGPNLAFVTADGLHAFFGNKEVAQRWYIRRGKMTTDYAEFRRKSTEDGAILENLDSS